MPIRAIVAVRHCVAIERVGTRITGELHFHFHFPV